MPAEQNSRSLRSYVDEKVEFREAQKSSEKLWRRAHKFLSKYGSIQREIPG